MESQFFSCLAVAVLNIQRKKEKKKDFIVSVVNTAKLVTVHCRGLF